MKKLPTLLLMLSMALFASSLFLPALVGNSYKSDPGLLCSGANKSACVAAEEQANASIDPQGSTYSSLQLLLSGFFGILLGIFAWYANPLYLLGLFFFMLKEYKSAVFLSLGAGAVAFTTFRTSIPLDEAGIREFRIHHPTWGFYLWVGSFAVLVLAAIVAHTRARQPVK